MLRCKVILGQDTRSWRYPQDSPFKALQAFIPKTFSSIAPDTIFFVQYQDDESDFVTISSETDLEEAFVLAKEEERKSLKLYVQTGSVENLHRAESVATMSVRSFPHSPRSVLKDASGASSDFEILVENRSNEMIEGNLECSVISEKKEDDIVDDDDEDDEDVEEVITEPLKTDADCHDSSDDEDEEEEVEVPSEEPKDWRSMLKIFMEETKNVHKSALEMLYDDLREGKSTLAGALEKVFNSFEELSQHRFVEKIGGVSVVCERAQMCNSWTPVLMQLGCENVESVLGEFVEAAIEHMIENDGSPDVCVDMGPLFKRLFPSFYKVLEDRLAKSQGKDVTVDLTEVFQANDAKGVAKAMMTAQASTTTTTKKNEEEDEMEDDDSITHHGVICDICNVNPIKGVRYKCAIRPNYDLCEKCEKLRSDEDRKYPMIKIKVPVRNIIGTYRFIGANEFCRQSRDVFKQRKHNGGGRRHHGHHGGHHHNHQSGGTTTSGFVPLVPFPVFTPPQAQRGFTPWGPPPPPPMHHAPPPHHPHPPHPHPHGHRFGHPGHHHRNPWHPHAPPPAHPPQPPFLVPDGLTVNTSIPVPQSPAASEVSVASSIRGSTKKLKANFIDDVTISDRSEHAPNTDLVKTWRMKNTGHQVWGGEMDAEEPRTKLVFIKGHENLAVEKEFDVPKACPGECVDVSAKLRTPDKEGRYCSYYRLEKDGVKFGPRVWVDLFVKDDKKQKMSKDEKKLEKLQVKKVKFEKKIEKNEQKKAKVLSRIQHLKKNEKKEKVYACICGEANFEKKLAQDCYGGEFVHCDLCGTYIDARQYVYHCPNDKKSGIHPQGYDVCQLCLKQQFQIEESVTSPQLKPKEAPVAPPKASAYPKLEPKKDAPVVPPKAPVVPPKPVAPVVVKPVVAGPPSAPPMPPFEFAQQLQSIQSMGFNDTDAICELLVNHKGNMETVVNILLQKSA